ncbi:hypothetical protein E2C01_036959 [Portunus trituberculatus]|uniref:Uncharacterized protein n=1 Tax=Portunus trituberculatus TaxID=210409 RepID=A0A5B7FCU1_PORTR|nr:hypothetical protein [Portunus trituberculatus]
MPKVRDEPRTAGAPLISRSGRPRVPDPARVADCRYITHKGERLRDPHPSASLQLAVPLLFTEGTRGAAKAKNKIDAARHIATWRFDRLCGTD